MHVSDVTIDRTQQVRENRGRDAGEWSGPTGFVKEWWGFVSVNTSHFVEELVRWKWDQCAIFYHRRATSLSLSLSHYFLLGLYYSLH